MRRVHWLVGSAVICIVVVVVIFSTTTAKGDEPTPAPTPTDPLAEPITDQPVWPEPGDETGPLEPFELPPTLPSAIPIEDLTPDEQAVVEAGMTDEAQLADSHAAFASATRQAAAEAAAEAAADDVGLRMPLDSIGVVP